MPRLTRYRTDYFLFALLALQLVFWFSVKDIKPNLSIVPPLPSAVEVKALAFGDEQFYFRVLGLEIQNAGDTFGRFTPLKNYDYKTLSKWFHLLDTLDRRSNYIPALASYYYGNSQNVSDVPYVVDYLEKHASYDPAQKWWWLSQAVYLANYRMEDKKRALELAKELAASPGKIPIWARQMPAFIMEDLGEKAEALALIQGLSESIDELSQGEINFMNYFIKDRLGYIKEHISRKPNKDDGVPASDQQ